METSQLIVVIDTQKFNINSKIYQQMQYLQEWRVLTHQSINICLINSVHLNQWNIILNILQHFDYDLPLTPKVRSNDPVQYIGKYLTKIFDQLSLKQLNQLYIASDFLKINKLKQLLGAYMATKVYISQKGDSITDRTKMKEFQVNLSIQKIKQYRQTYHFLNKK